MGRLSRDVVRLALQALSCLIIVSVLSVQPGPRYQPTRGEVWPKPKLEVKLQDYYIYDTSNFQIKLTGYNCTILWNAIHRYSYVMRHLKDLSDARKRAAAAAAAMGATTETTTGATTETTTGATDPLWRGALQNLTVDLTQPCEDMPHAHMDEAYELSVSASSMLRSASLWGALRGLETFAQLFYLSNDYTEVRINGTRIADAPRYSHRGLLVDTARHYLSLHTLRATLRAMTMNKMNVLHWHIVDDQSFPYQSDRFPEISEKGAFLPSMVYSGADVAALVEYARERGIRVIPEFDVPGHTRSWGEAYPNLLTECYDQPGSGPGRAQVPVGLGPLHPLRNTTYKLLRELFREAQARFPDAYFHLGGDEVDLSCWASNPELSAYMREHNLTTRGLHALFMGRALPLLGEGSTPVVWQEVFDERVPLPNNTVVQVWFWKPVEMIPVLEAGYEVVYSSQWYLDHLQDTFEDFLTVDPRAAVAQHRPELAARVRGGEACMWAEMVDDTNMLARVWPRASAVAERLWSPALSARREWGGWQRGWVPKIPEHDLRRAEEHVCRMRRRGVPAQPAAGPGFCLTANDGLQRL